MYKIKHLLSPVNMFFHKIQNLFHLVYNIGLRALGIFNGDIILKPA